MKQLIKVVLFVMLLGTAKGQILTDSLERKLSKSKPDTNRVKILSELTFQYAYRNGELAMKYAQQGLALARALKFQKGEADCLRRSGIVLLDEGRCPDALNVFQQSLKISESIKDLFGIGAACGHIADLNLDQGDYSRARLYYARYLKVTEQERNNNERANALRGMGSWYMEQDHPDSASWAFSEIFKLVDTSKRENFIYAAPILRDLGNLEAKRGNQEQAMHFFRECIHYAATQNYFNTLSMAYLGIANLLLQQEHRDSGISYAQLALRAAQKSNYGKGIVNASQLLSRLYEFTDEHEAFKYQKMAAAFKDSLFNIQTAVRVQNLQFDESQREQALENARMNYRNQLRLYVVLSALGIFLLLAIVLYHNNIKTRRANALLKSQKEEIQQQRAKAESILAELKSTQAQLIQSLQHQTSELEMQALRAQMNPHFIFNSLNSINRFILQKNSLQASEYLTKFSRLIRMILNSSANATVSLAEDTEALELYLELERLRCEEKFNFKIKCDPDIDVDDIQVPPMLLQPFVENAIWHGLMHKESEGHLLINIQQENSNLVCVIADDGVGRKRSAELKNKSVKHKSMGMKITESRIAMIEKMGGENKAVEIRDLVDADGKAAGTEVILTIPVI
jgi:hypothetical protein